MENLKIKAENRTERGKGPSRRLRRDGYFPGIVYGNGEPKKIKINHNNMLRCLQDSGFYSNILTLEIDHSKRKSPLSPFPGIPRRNRYFTLTFKELMKTQKFLLKCQLN